MSNSSLPPFSIAMWFVALSHHPHFPSLPLPFSVSLCASLSLTLCLRQCEEDSSFLTSLNREPQQSSLLPMTHSPTSKAPLRTTRSPAVTAHHTTPRPRSQSSTACCFPLSLQVFLPVFACFCVSLSAWLSCLVNLFSCLWFPSYSWLGSGLALLRTSQSYWPVWLSAAVYSACPLALNGKVKMLKDKECRLRCLHVKPWRLVQKNNDTTIQTSAKKETLVLLVKRCFSFCVSQLADVLWNLTKVTVATVRFHWILPLVCSAVQKALWLLCWKSLECNAYINNDLCRGPALQQIWILTLFRYHLYVGPGDLLTIARAIRIFRGIMTGLIKHSCP